MKEGISFDKLGAGSPVILLHGFPMNRQVWDDFAPKLAQNFTVFMPDLPGFGDSPLMEGSFSLTTIATRILAWMKAVGISSPAAIVGHSMGGYVALEMARQSPSSFHSLVLFHSTALADSSEKKESRTKVVDFVKTNGVLAFTSNFIQPLFADQDHPAIQTIRNITVQATAESVTGYTTAMRDRRDNQKVLEAFTGNVLLIGGDSDKGIPEDSLVKQGDLGSHIEVEILVDTGHMGMVEKPDETLALIRKFLRKK